MLFPTHPQGSLKMCRGLRSSTDVQSSGNLPWVVLKFASWLGGSFSRGRWQPGCAFIFLMRIIPVESRVPCWAGIPGSLELPSMCNLNVQPNLYNSVKQKMYWKLRGEHNWRIMISWSLWCQTWAPSIPAEESQNGYIQLNESFNKITPVRRCLLEWKKCSVLVSKVLLTMLFKHDQFWEVYESEIEIRGWRFWSFVIKISRECQQLLRIMRVSMAGIWLSKQH